MASYSCRKRLPSARTFAQGWPGIRIGAKSPSLTTGLADPLQTALDCMVGFAVAGRSTEDRLRVLNHVLSVIGGGTFGAVMASTLFLNDVTHSRRILVLESGPFTLPEHVQNMPFQGGTPDFRAPWDSHPGLGYAGLMFTVGGRSLAWGGWSPQLLAAEFKNWPDPVVAALID